MNSSAPLLDYFERLYIIHLPERVDRYRALGTELLNIGIDIQDPKVYIPHAPKPNETNGFTSIGVYGNFLSHLGILREALKDGLENVWILEDDAIFRRKLRQPLEQEKIVQHLTQNHWDLCYLGHHIQKADLRGYPLGLVPYTGEFIWAHCYCVNGKTLHQLVQYMEETLENPSGHPRGGRVYIDGALNLFRRFYPEIVCLVSNPNLSNQKGSPSSLAGGRWYDRMDAMRFLVTAAREIRDELWRING